ncbi:Intraflagellar transport protein 46 [Fasciola hepatica]|uniref:Intraflagellar transport protein 46 homolog n=1 Tax=Fasciola hepatica TaxID=6192 RepID=A0A4E0RH13_FASHE|nr:Intraflagellar transport protein 46 [Fasciola hepatica]
MPSDKPYDETIDVPDSEDIATPRPQKAVYDTMEEFEDRPGKNKKKVGQTSESQLTTTPPAGVNLLSGMKSATKNTDRVNASETGSSEDDDEDEDDDDEDEDNTPEVVEGAYNPADYEHLAVSAEIKEMFEYIQRYTPQVIELETHLKPFIPDYIAAVGDIDAFLKVPRPDGKPDNLGLLVLDEPCANQSDPTVLDLHLRALSKQSASKKLIVKSIQNAEQQSKEIDSWIKSIADLYRAKPPPTVHYIKNMPEVSTLMAEWPSKFEDSMRNLSLPGSQLDCSLKEYIDIICALLDIPVYNNRIHSLHLLFTLYLEFKNSQHFRQKDSGPQTT